MNIDDNTWQNAHQLIHSEEKRNDFALRMVTSVCVCECALMLFWFTSRLFNWIFLWNLANCRNKRFVCCLNKLMGFACVCVWMCVCVHMSPLYYLTQKPFDWYCLLFVRCYHWCAKSKTKNWAPLWLPLSRHSGYYCFIFCFFQTAKSYLWHSIDKQILRTRQQPIKQMFVSKEKKKTFPLRHMHAWKWCDFENGNTKKNKNGFHPIWFLNEWTMLIFIFLTWMPLIDRCGNVSFHFSYF